MTRSNGVVIVADPHGIAWGEGYNVAEALSDWEIAAREIAGLLAGREIDPGLEERRSILRRWLG